MSKKSILQKVLAILARMTRKKYRPMVIGVTGSVGKTSTRMAIFSVLKKKFSVRTAEKNYNNEIGVALTILGMPHCGRNVLKWAAALASAAGRLTIRDPRYPSILILEYGIDRPGDMDYLLSLARPDIAVVTAVGVVPAHVEFFSGPEELSAEKAKLVTALKAHKSKSSRDRGMILTYDVFENSSGAYAILNHDDPAVYGMRTKTKAQVISFGADADADVRIISYELRLNKDSELGDIPAGISFKIEHKGSVVPVRLNDTFGVPAAYAAAAAAAVGIAMKMNLVDISAALREYAPPAGRMRLLRAIKHSFILDDTYNASPEAMRAALDTLGDLPAQRKIAVLGDMPEIGTYTEDAHRAIGSRAASVADVIFCVGMRAKFIADAAIARGFDRTKIFQCEDALSAGRALDSMIRAGDLVLIKGSQGMRMERAVEEIMGQPERAAELLVRQDSQWKSF